MAENPPGMRHFKVPLIVTLIALLLAVGGGLAGVTMIHKSGKSAREKKERAELLGQGVAFVVLLVIFPFWIFAAAKAGKERREAREAQRSGGASREGERAAGS